METLSLNKSSLKLQRDWLKTFQRFLPALDLKRRQLTVELKIAQRVLEATRREITQLMVSLEGLLELLGAAAMDLSDYVKIRAVEIDEENVIGASLPVLRNVECLVEDYSALATPSWVDTLVKYLQIVSSMHVREQVEKQRVSRLDKAVLRITQRVNLFEKILIPTAQENIHRICIYLGDAERAAVVRSKLVKAKRQEKASLLDYR